MAKMKTVAIACQGGGLNAAFTWGALRKILTAKRTLDHQEAAESFDIIGLSGTSAGALCAFMAWYGLVPKRNSPGSIDEAIGALDKLWDTFAAKTPGEKLFNTLAIQTLRFQQQGFPEVKISPYSLLHDLLMKQIELMGLRREFYDFTALLESCVPKLETIKQSEVTPRLLIGAVEILSGHFEPFDSKETDPATRKNISLSAVRASGTLPDIRKAEVIENALRKESGTETTRDRYYWDGLWSQNPPIRQFFTNAKTLDEKPDELWLIRINPRERDRPPMLVEEIEDRRNELSGNISLNQELEFIKSVNGWVKKFPDFGSEYKEVVIREIGMSKAKSAQLDLASKFDRSQEFIAGLREHGEQQAEVFLKKWPDGITGITDPAYRFRPA